MRETGPITAWLNYRGAQDVARAIMVLLSVGGILRALRQASDYLHAWPIYFSSGQLRGDPEALAGYGMALLPIWMAAMLYWVRALTLEVRQMNNRDFGQKLARHVQETNRPR